MANEEGADEVEISSGSSFSIAKYGLALAILLVGGGGGAWITATWDPLGLTGQEAQEATEEAASAENSLDGDDRAIHSLGIFTINLRGKGSLRTLRMEVQVETTQSSLSTIEQRQAQLRDSVISLVSDYAYVDLEGLDGKTRLKDELLGRLNGLLGSSRIERIYLSEFVVE